MRKTTALTAAIVVLLTAAALLPAASAVVFQDGFEPQVNDTIWPKAPGWSGPQAQEYLQGDDSHIRVPGMSSGRVWVNYRVTYNGIHQFGVYQDNIYATCWMFEDNDLAFPGYYSEYVPNSYLTLADTTTVNDVFKIGVMAANGINRNTKVWFQDLAVETGMEGALCLDGTLGRPLVPRRQGWRKYTILVHPYTGFAGDVQFFVDDVLVYNGMRMPSPMGGGAPVDSIILGNKEWTNETYWFDQPEVGTIERPERCSTIAEAKDLADGTWVELAPKVVTGSYITSPFPGYLAVEEDDRSSGIWVSSSYPAVLASGIDQAEKLSIRGIVATNEAGVKYLNAIQITQDQALADQPRPLATCLKNISDGNLDGKLVKVWGKVLEKGQERAGDWRRYFTITDGSSNAPIKCYYDNIIAGTDPVPNVNAGDYVCLVGVPQTEVITIGDLPNLVEQSQTGVWIRKAGDLTVLRLAGTY